MRGHEASLEVKRRSKAVLEAFALQSLLSSFCSWFLKRGLLPANPVEARARLPH